MREIKAKLSGDAKGGAILLGLRGVVLIGHGATSVEAVKNGTLAAAEAVRAGLVEQLVGYPAGLALGAAGRPAIGALGLEHLADAPRFRLVDTRRIGPDLMHRWLRA